MRILRLTIFIAILLLLAAVFAFVGELSDKASAPYLYESNVSAGADSNGDIGSSAGGSQTVSPPPIGSGASGASPAATDNDAANGAPGSWDANPPLGQSPPGGADPAPEQEYITVEIDEFYLHKGSLLLINHDNRFEPPAYPDLVLISDFKTSSYRITDSKLRLSYSIMPHLNKMMDDFSSETGSSAVTIISAYRDNDKQQAILNEYIALVGAAEAGKWASPPGYSEHHTGMAFDLGVYSGGSVKAFYGTGAYAWFKENAYKYGFILRYPPDKTDITRIANEPWHYRYVGDVHAFIMKENDLCLEEYIGFIMDHPPEGSYKIEYGADTYEVFFTQSSEFSVPKGCEYTISGNNSDGYIITVKTELPIE